MTQAKAQQREKTQASDLDVLNIEPTNIRNSGPRIVQVKRVKTKPISAKSVTKQMARLAGEMCVQLYRMCLKCWMHVRLDKYLANGCRSVLTVVSRCQPRAIGVICCVELVELRVEHAVWKTAFCCV